jgi:biopolymer transport protein ExbB
MRRISSFLQGALTTWLAFCGLIVLPTILTRTGLADEPRAATGRRVAATGAGTNFEFEFDPSLLERQAGTLIRAGLTWYERTPPADRVCWGGLIACVGLGLGVSFERMVRLRRRRIIPTDFTARFLDRLHEGKLDGGRALDYCEMNPSPAARVALAAVRRWGRPAPDLERAVTLAHRVESEALRRNVGTLRRIAALAPLLGLLGTLQSLQRVLSLVPEVSPAALRAGAAVPVVAWAPALADALGPLTAGIAIATLALVIYDALSTRIERLTGTLDRLGAETIDAIAMTTLPTVVPLLSPANEPRTPGGNTRSPSPGQLPSARLRRDEPRPHALHTNLDRG